MVHATCVCPRKCPSDIAWRVMDALRNGGSATLLFCVSSLDVVGVYLMILCPHARDENLNPIEKTLTSVQFPVCSACDSVCGMVYRECRTVSRGRTSFGHFQRVPVTRSPQRQASLMGFGAMRRSCGDCRHQSTEESSGVGLIWFAIDNIGCGSRKCPSMRWRRFG